MIRVFGHGRFGAGLGIVVGVAGWNPKESAGESRKAMVLGLAAV